MVLLALFTIKHNLTAEAIQSLTLFSLAFPSSHCLPNAVNKFKNYFKRLRNPLSIHYYCSFCLTYIESKTSTTCPNGHCLQDLKKPKSLAKSKSYSLYGCWKCLQAGNTVKTGPKGHARAFPFNHADPKGPLRTNDLTLEPAKEAMHDQMAGKPRYAI